MRREQKILFELFFLAEKNALLAFESNFDVDFYNSLGCGDPTSQMDDNFKWANTAQGHQFWNKLEMDFQQEYSDYLQDEIAELTDLKNRSTGVLL